MGTPENPLGKEYIANKSLIFGFLGIGSSGFDSFLALPRLDYSGLFLPQLLESLRSGQEELRMFLAESGFNTQFLENNFPSQDASLLKTDIPFKGVTSWDKVLATAIEDKGRAPEFFPVLRSFEVSFERGSPYVQEIRIDTSLLAQDYDISGVVAGIALVPKNLLKKCRDGRLKLVLEKPSPDDASASEHFLLEKGRWRKSVSVRRLPEGATDFRPMKEEVEKYRLVYLGSSGSR